MGHRFLGVEAMLDDLEEGYARLFDHVDATRGDALLGLFWWSDPQLSGRNSRHRNRFRVGRTTLERAAGRPLRLCQGFLKDPMVSQIQDALRARQAIAHMTGYPDSLSASSKLA